MTDMGQEPFEGAGEWNKGHASDPVEVKMLSQGKVVIPAAIRQQLNLGTGSRLYISVGEDGVIRLAARSVVAERLRGSGGNRANQLLDTLRDT